MYNFIVDAAGDEAENFPCVIDESSMIPDAEFFALAPTLHVLPKDTLDLARAG